MKKVTVADGCWLWVGALCGNGYGYFWYEYRVVQAHRASYELFVGPIPEGMEPDHTCHSKACPGGKTCPHRRCVNPDHLEPVTHRVNCLRGVAGAVQGAEARSKTHCVQGHEFTEANTYLSVRPSGTTKRACQICRALRSSEYNARVGRARASR